MPYRAGNVKSHVWVPGSLKGINLVYGSDNPVQRCRNHKLKNVMDRLPDELKDQVKSVMKGAYRLDADEGISKLKRQAKWLEQEYPSAASSLLEGLEETFTINRLGLPCTLLPTIFSSQGETCPGFSFDVSGFAGFFFSASAPDEPASVVFACLNQDSLIWKIKPLQETY